MNLTQFSGKNACNNCSVATVVGPLERTSDHAGAIPHNVQAHPLLVGRLLGQPASIIFDGQDPAPICRAKTDDDVGCLAVLDRVMYRFLRDSIEMICDIFVANETGL